ncbi:MAG: ATP-binding cassette domain-containing protein [Streptosporangiaceae bacterium]
MAIGAGTAYTSFDRPGTGVPMAPSSSAAPSGATGPGRPEIVAVTTRGALVVLNPLTGVATRILVAGGVVGGAVSVSSDGATAYFAVKHGCVDEIESVPVAGGRPAVIAPGVLPAISPDGTRLALAREPFGGGPAPSGYLNGCHQPAATGAEFEVAIRDLPDGHETLYPVPPGAASTLPYPVSRLSWAPDGKRLLVSVGPSQDNEGWDLVQINPATSRYYLPSSSAVPLTGPPGKRAVICENLVLTGNTRSFGTEIWFDDRIAILGANGSGKTSFLRLLAGEQVPHEGLARLGARVVPGFFAQTHARPDLAGRTPLEILMTEHALLINEAMSALARYELQSCARQPFGTLSGGQQARLQILLLELAGSTRLLLDEPTDNLDLPSAEALQQGLESYQGTVLAVTHDRWFARSFERFLIFTPDGDVREATEPAWD